MYCHVFWAHVEDNMQVWFYRIYFNHLQLSGIKYLWAFQGLSFMPLPIQWGSILYCIQLELMKYSLDFSWPASTFTGHNQHAKDREQTKSVQSAIGMSSWATWARWHIEPLGLTLSRVDKIQGRYSAEPEWSVVFVCLLVCFLLCYISA